MAQLSKQNIEIIRDAVRKGLISLSIADALYDKSARNQTSLRDIQFILNLSKQLATKKGFKPKRP